MYVHFTPINIFYYIFTQSSPTSLGNMPLTIDLKLLMIVCFHTEISVDSGSEKSAYYHYNTLFHKYISISSFVSNTDYFALADRLKSLR